MKKLQNFRKNLSLLLILSLIVFLVPQKLAFAAPLTSLSDTMSRMKASTASNHTTQFTIPASDDIIQSETITVTFPTGFTLTGIDCGDVDLEDDTVNEELNTEAGGCTAGAAVWGASVSGQVLTLTAPSNAATYINTGSVVKIEIGTNALYNDTGNEQITNQTVAQNDSDQKILLNADGDTGTIAVEIVADDQIPVTATVDPTITFTVVNTTLALGTLSSSSISTTGYNNITIGTNGSGGYNISVKDIGSSSNPGLWNAPASKLIASATATLSVGNEGYGGNCNKVSGDGSCTFADGATENVTGFTLAGPTFASFGSKPSGTDTFQIRVKAAISTSTDAGSYNDTLTFIGTANF